MPYRLLHISDVHLERAFAGMGCSGELARRRRLGLRSALRRAGEAAREARCDAITIGGDLYEHDRASPATGAFLAELFATWQPMRVFLAPGNHDPLIPGSLYATTEWPANVHLFQEERLQPVELTDGLTLWGLAHRDPRWQGDPLECETTPADGVHIALFHGAEIGSRPDGKAMHGPFRAADIRRRGFAAALCGHYHRRHWYDDTGLLYPGTPEPLAFDETGARGPVVVDIDESGEVVFTPLALNLWNVATIDCNIADADSSSDIAEMAIDVAKSCATDLETSNCMLQLRLIGSPESSVSIDTRSVEHQVRDSGNFASVQVKDCSSIALDAQSLAEEPSVRGEFARSMLERVESGDEDQRELLEEALRYGLEALSGLEVGLR